MKKALLISLLVIIVQGCLSDNSTLKSVDHRSAKEDKTVTPDIERVSIGSCPEFKAETVRLLKSIDDWKTLQTPGRILGTDVAGYEVGPALDFGHSAGLFVSIGNRPTPGYKLALNKNINPSSNTLTLSLTVSKPAADAILAQLITYPCALFSIPASGYTEIKVFFEEDGEKKMIQVTP